MISRLFFPISYSPPQGAIIHSLVDFPYAVLAYRFARRHGLRIVFNAVGTYSVAPFNYYIDKILFMSAYRGADGIVAISKYTKRHMIKVGGVRSVSVIYLPAVRPVAEGNEDFSLFKLLPSGMRYILTISSPRAGGRKGFDSLLRAFQIVSRSIADVHLIAIGGDAVSNPSYTVFPSVTPEQLAGLYARCAIFAAMPRAVDGHFEGYGLVYHEAGLYGRPVIGTRSGGVPEAIDDGVTGLLIPEEDVQEMASAIIRLLSDSVLATRLGEVGRAHALNWTWDDYVGVMLSFYRSLR
jgi:glycosyltransferase involved in cell wall biosynthesis